MWELIEAYLFFEASVWVLSLAFLLLVVVCFVVLKVFGGLDALKAGLGQSKWRQIEYEISEEEYGDGEKGKV